MEENPIQCELSWKCFGCLICTSEISIFALICISYSYLTPYRRPVFTSSFPLTSCRDLSQFCTQIAHKLSPKIPCFSPCRQPYDRSRTSRIFFAPHLEIAVNFHLKFCQQYTRNLSNFTAFTLLHPSKSQIHPYTKNPRNIIYYRDFIYSICKIR